MTVLAVEPPLRQWECSMSYMQVDKVTVNSLGTTDTLSRAWRLQTIWQELLRELPVDPGASIKPQRKRREINQTQTKSNRNGVVVFWWVYMLPSGFVFSCRRSDAALCLQSAVSFLSQLRGTVSGDETRTFTSPDFTQAKRRERVALTSAERLELLSLFLR